MNRIALVVASLGLALVACRGDDAPPGDDTMIDAPAVVGEVTIQEIQNDAMAAGTVVEVKGVVVTAIDSYGNRTGDLWVQEVGGGEFSGVKVFGAPLDQIAALAPGDLVDIIGAQKDEFALTSDTSMNKVTELKPVTGGAMTITKVGTGTVPAPATVDAKAISLLPTAAARDMEWEKWEGVLIKVTNARQLGNISSFGSNPGPDSNEFRASGFVRVQSALTALPATGATVGVCWDSITGVGDYFFNWILAPRSAADFVGSGTGCRPAATSVAMVQTGTDTEIVNLTQVYVTARDDIGTTMTPLGSRGVWVADSLAGAVNNGVYVFIGTVMADPNLPTMVIGARVDISGGVEEFDLGSMGNPPVGDKLTEITGATITNITAAGAAPTPLAATAALAGDIGAPGEPYEGVLVRFTNVKVTNLNAGAGKVELTDNAAGKVIMDNDAFNWSAPAALNICYSTLTGVMSVQINDNVRTVNPRNAGDMVTGTGCN